MRYVLATTNRKGNAVYVEQMMHGFSTTPKVKDATKYEESEIHDWIRYGIEEFNRDVFAIQLYDKKQAHEKINEMLAKKNISELDEESLIASFRKLPDEVTMIEIKELLEA